MTPNSKYRELLAKYPPRPIRTQQEYERALVQLEKVMVPHPDAARSQLIEVLATLIESYEARQYPTPDLDPAEMLTQLLSAKGVKPAEVARATRIPPATLSNVLAGRRNISKQNAFKLGEYFGLSPVVFLNSQPKEECAAS